MNFNIFKKKNVVWRNSDGEIICPGDSCPQECDDSCPIWCQTIAVSALQAGKFEASIEWFNKALSIAPDYKEAWVNLGTIYGQHDKHLEANKYFMMAYNIDNNYEKAIRGLIASYKNIGHFDEAFQFCDIYEKNVGDKAEAEVIRQTVREAQSSGQIRRRESDISMGMDIVNKAREMKILAPNDKMPNIPEIMAEKKRTCSIILEELIELGKKEVSARNPITWFMWAMYAGMGAVYHWNINWNDLKAKGIPETLLEPRGVFEMDEYVMDIIGIGFNSEEYKELNPKLMALAMMMSSEKLNPSKNDITRDDILEFMQAMYIFGMVFEMERLGMR